MYFLYRKNEEFDRRNGMMEGLIEVKDIGKYDFDKIKVILLISGLVYIVNWISVLG